MFDARYKLDGILKSWLFGVGLTPLRREINRATLLTDKNDNV